MEAIFITALISFIGGVLADHFLEAKIKARIESALAPAAPVAK